MKPNLSRDVNLVDIIKRNLLITPGHAQYSFIQLTSKWLKLSIFLLNNP